MNTPSGDANPEQKPDSAQEPRPKNGAGTEPSGPAAPGNGAAAEPGPGQTQKPTPEAVLVDRPALETMLRCAGRELGMRRNTYPKWVPNRMSQDKADREIAAQEKIYALLKSLDEFEAVLGYALRFLPQGVIEINGLKFAAEALQAFVRLSEPGKAYRFNRVDDVVVVEKVDVP